ncbi:hypothetical protein I302_105733 [Kwoniella bestiolae CBS 10118]|uniref:Uncharacterized protein n=1 Tax=Kwoniella bestiolae CBS 10118 TaxID=1296100 RepID=A0A1B9G1Z8_9TREE|nr:hypothetical protein I302_04853 [Kwoniella bestiolae CBS 10118]OCF25043.1 hypothetical protein I302_04853 [Kwoniella bestiolae CBS 10118]
MVSSRSSVLLLIATQLLSLLPTSSASVLSRTDDQPPRPIEREVLGSATSPSIRKRASGYTNPADNGGYMLTIVNGTYPAGLGEPLNVILSADSDKEVLVKSTDKGGFLNYMLVAGLGEECLGQHLGSIQEANLGDSQGNVSEVEELRYNYGNPYIGTCQETFNGGLHLRYWIQNTTNAYFLAVSVEMDLNSGHDIVRNGYNIGRDQLVSNLTGTNIVTEDLTNTSTFSGTGTYMNYTYQTDVQYVPGLLKNSSDDINHYITVEENGQPAIDGLVAVLTVKITGRPPSSGAWSTISQIPLISIFMPLLLTSVFTLF